MKPNRRWHFAPARAGLALAGALLIAAVPAAEHRLSFGGLERSYQIELPAGAPTQGAPTLIALHGGGGRAELMARQSGLWWPTPMAPAGGPVRACSPGIPVAAAAARPLSAMWTTPASCAR